MIARRRLRRRRARRRHRHLQGQGLHRRHEAPQLQGPGRQPRQPQEAPRARRDRRLRHAGPGVQGHEDGRPARQRSRSPRSTSRSSRATPSAACSSSRARCPGPTGSLVFVRNAVKGPKRPMAASPADAQPEASRAARVDVAQPTSRRRSRRARTADAGRRAPTRLRHRAERRRSCTRSSPRSSRAARAGHAQHQDPRRGRRRRREAVAPEGHRPGPPGLDPRAALARRWRRPRPQAPRLPQRTPKKMVRLALRSALSDRAADGRVKVVDDWGIDEPKTKRASRCSRRSACARRASARRACCSCSTGPTTRRGSRSATSATGCRSCSPRSSTPTTCSSTTGSCSPGHARRDRRRFGDGDSARHRRRADVERRAAEATNDVTHATSSSGRSSRRSRTRCYDDNVYTFVVADDANKIEIRQAVEEIFNVQGHQREHAEPPGQAQAQPPDR